MAKKERTPKEKKILRAAIILMLNLCIGMIILIIGHFCFDNLKYNIASLIIDVLWIFISAKIFTNKIQKLKEDTTPEDRF
jgi:hypothetical protein